MPCSSSSSQQTQKPRGSLKGSQGTWLKWFFFESASNVWNFHDYLKQSVGFCHNAAGSQRTWEGKCTWPLAAMTGLGCSPAAAGLFWVLCCFAWSWPVAALPLSYVLHFSAWLQLKIMLHLPSFLLDLYYISLLKKRWLPLGKPGVSFSFLN